MAIRNKYPLIHIENSLGDLSIPIYVYEACHLGRPADELGI
jgi:hypothetical protein